MRAVIFEFNSIAELAGEDKLPGPISPENQLKWAVYLALNNSPGNPVRVTVDNDGDDPHGLDSK